MKKSFFAILFLVSIMSFSQTQTKRYNSMTKRYEYFDSRGNMIGYEFYNTMTRQWEYYETKSQNSYQEPAKVDLSPTLNALSILQDRYDNNVQQVQNNINNISQKIDELDVTNYEREQIRNAFAKLIAENLSGQKFNYSSASETNRIINWLYDSTNRIIKNVTSKENNTDKISRFYNKKLNVNKIMIFNDPANKGEVYIKSDSYVIISENKIVFKKADGEILERNLYNKRYVDRNGGGYEFSSDYGGVFIQEKLDFVEFYDTNEINQYSKKNYTYYINYNFE